MIHPDTELLFIHPSIGHGLVAVKPIPMGTIVWARDSLDLVIEPAEYARIGPPRKDLLYKYCFVDGRGRHVLCWDHGRFVNHSCRANCLSPGFDFEIAVRDILPGEQLTDDYGLLNPDKDFPCSCGEPDCRRIIRPDDPERLHAHWDALVRQAFPAIATVEQPLWEFVPDKERVLACCADPSLIPSCLAHYRCRVEELQDTISGDGKNDENSIE